MSDAADRRCPSCGALVAADAEWCGQCFTSLGGSDPDPAPVTGPLDVTDGRPTAPSATSTREAAPDAPAFWPCPVCQARNPVAADTCETCGTPFAEAMRTGSERPHVETREAVTRSLIFPGLGHRAAGYPTDGFVRAVLFGVSLSIAVLAGLGGAGSLALLTIVVVNLVVAIGVYVLSAVEASRLAEGGELLVPSRTLLWVLVGDVFLSIGIVGFAVVSATRG